MSGRIVPSDVRNGEDALDFAPLQPWTTTTSESGGSFAFACLLFLTFVIYVAPQMIFPMLEPLYLAMVSAVLGVGAYAHAVIRGHRLTIISPEIKLVFWFMALAIVSIPFSAWPGGSFEFFNQVFIKSIIVFFLVANLLTSQDRLRIFFWALALFQAYNAYIGIDRYASGDVYSLRGGSKGSYSGLTSDANDLALSLTMAIPVVWYLFESSKSTFQKFISGGILVLCLAGVVLSYSRGGFLALLAVFLWFAYRKIKQGKKRIVVAAVLAFAITLLLAPGSYSDRIFSIVDDSKDATGSATSRWDAMVEASKIIVAHPLGAGLKMHNQYLPCRYIGCPGVHNVFLEVTADLGVAGGVLFLMLLWKLFASMGRISLDRRSARDEIPRIAEAMQASFVAFAVGGFFLALAYMFPLYYLMGIAVALKDVADRESPLSESGSNESVSES